MDALATGGARSVPALVRGLRHPDGEVVMFSAGVLARTGSPAAIPHLVSLLDHDDINVVQQVIDGLSQIRSTLAVEALVKVLDRDPWLRFAAVHALGEIGDQRAVSALAPLIDDESVRGAVIRAMGRSARRRRSPSCFGSCARARTRRRSPMPPGDRRGARISAEPGGSSEHRRLDGARVPVGGGLHERLEQVLASEAATRRSAAKGRTPGSRPR